MISTTTGGGGGITNQSQVLTPNIINTTTTMQTPGMSIVDQSGVNSSVAVEGGGSNKNPRSQHPASGNLIAQIVAKA